MPLNVRAKSNNHKLVSNQRERIAKAALSLYMKRGFRNTGVHDVAKASRMSVGNLYNYIGSREDILLLVLELGLRVQTGLQEIVRSTEHLKPGEALPLFIRSAYQLIDRNQDFISFFFFETKHLAPKARKSAADVELLAMTHIEELLKKGHENGEFEFIANVRAFSHNLFVIIEMWAVRQWLYKDMISLEDQIQMHTECVMKCVKKT